MEEISRGKGSIHLRCPGCHRRRCFPALHIHSGDCGEEIEQRTWRRSSKAPAPRRQGRKIDRDSPRPHSECSSPVPPNNQRPMSKFRQEPPSNRNRGNTDVEALPSHIRANIQHPTASSWAPDTPKKEKRRIGHQHRDHRDMRGQREKGPIPTATVWNRRRPPSLGHAIRPSCHSDPQNPLSSRGNYLIRQESSISAQSRPVVAMAF